MLVQVGSSCRLRVAVPAGGEGVGIDKLETAVASSEEVKCRATAYRTGSSDDQDPDSKRVRLGRWSGWGCARVTHDVSNVSSFDVVIFQRLDAEMWMDCSSESL